MKSEGLLKPALIALVAAVVLYAVAYTGIEHRRTRKGPWEITFTRDNSGAPALLINQPFLALTNIQIVFPGETFTNVSATTLILREPRPVPHAAPFGKCIFMDTTFLPGTVVFDCFGHEIQLIPRALRIDRKEQPWRSNETISLASTNLSRPPSL